MHPFTQTLAAPIGVVYDSFTTATRLSEWFCYDAQLEVVPEGRFYAYWREGKFYAMGEYLEVFPNEKLRLKWSDCDGNTGNLEIRFATQDTGTTVEATYDFEIGSRLRNLWERALLSLKSTLERGYHMDALERPMLGVIIGAQIDADNAERFGVPVHHGVLLEGVLTGLSAESAGLQRGDVIANVDGQEITDATVLPNITRAHKAGDTLEVVYYRGATRHSARMELKPRPLQPEVDSLETFAAQIQAYKSEVLRELDDVVRDFTEEETRFKPAPNAWSAQEVIAHLINTERDTQTMIASLENGNELEVFTGNMDARVRATVRRYPTMTALVAALKDTHAETVDLVRHLPEHFLLRKAHVVRVQQNAEFDPSHTRRHFTQMQRAVAAARASAVPA
jgi:uncharacterized protein YndB with AHSA1/START domain